MTTLPLMAEWALRSSLLIAAGVLLLRACRVKDASVRLGVYVAMLCGSLAIPAITLAAPGLPFIVRQAARTPESAPMAKRLAPQSALPSAVHPNVSVQISSAQSFSLQVSSPRVTTERIAAVAYAAVAGFLLLRLIVGLGLGWRLLRSSRSTGRKAAGVDVRESDRLTVPVTLGILRPAIVLPQDWRDWDETKLQAVLTHERSHVERRDPLVQAVSAVHRALLWLTPLSWVLHHRIVRVAEEASDDAALSAVSDRASYASVLLDFMRTSPTRVTWQGVAMARNGRPEDRILRVLNETVTSHGVSLRAAFLIAALSAPVTYMVAAVRPQEAPPPPMPPVASAPQAPATVITTTPTELPEPVQPKRGPQAPVAPPPPPTQSAETQVAAQSTTDQEPANGSVRSYIIVNGDSMMVESSHYDLSNSSDLKSRFGNDFAWFRQNGKEYVITDAATMADIDKAMEPQKGVNRMQAGVNDEQSRVNALQAKVNAHQADVNAVQNQVNHRQDLANQVQDAVNRGSNDDLIKKLEAEIAALREKPDVNQAAVNHMQSQVNEEQAGVNAEQAKVNSSQSKVNTEQHRVSAEINQKLQQIFAGALKDGTAKSPQ